MPDAPGQQRSEVTGTETVLSVFVLSVFGIGIGTGIGIGITG